MNKKTSPFVKSFALASLLTFASAGCHRSEWFTGHDDVSSYYFRDPGEEKLFAELFETLEEQRQEEQGLKKLETIDCYKQKLAQTDRIFIPKVGDKQVQKIFPKIKKTGLERHATITVYQANQGPSQESLSGTYITIVVKKDAKGGVQEAIIKADIGERFCLYEIWNIDDGYVTRGHSGGMGAAAIPKDRPVYEPQ